MRKDIAAPSTPSLVQQQIRVYLLLLIIILIYHYHSSLIQLELAAALAMESMVLQSLSAWRQLRSYSKSRRQSQMAGQPLVEPTRQRQYPIRRGPLQSDLPAELTVTQQAGPLPKADGQRDALRP